ncbi:hypothetical protein [Halanaerobium kushneri]|uniref:Uncharacterized protein n=1 Tax=Halanaerobium kushneri TaxID=56779 RepID=A0A1N6Y7J3_9FIRM|nr:hypothetical protein [Halanaerobium kushneri]SIR10524.1 hypothetical protein SAMN05421834_11370 [Halanaerobium kushneri]
MQIFAKLKEVLRLPDMGGNGDYIFKVREQINKKTKANLVMSVDGPSGPQHEIKDVMEAKIRDN